jgi:hypothetical protein
MGYTPEWDFADIALSMKSIINKFKNQAYCILFDPTMKIIDRDITAGTTTVIQFALGSGPCRVQPFKRPLVAREQANDTRNRLFQFWLDFPIDGTLPDMRSGLEFVVTNGGNDPYLRNYQYIIDGAENSSAAWQRTVNTSVNVESRPDYQWAFFVGALVGVSDATVTTEYRDALNVWHPYSVQKTGTKAIYRVPVFVGPSFRVTISKTGFTSVVSGVLDPDPFEELSLPSFP